MKVEVQNYSKADKEKNEILPNDAKDLETQNQQDAGEDSSYRKTNSLNIMEKENGLTQNESPLKDQEIQQEFTNYETCKSSSLLIPKSKVFPSDETMQNSERANLQKCQNQNIPNDNQNAQQTILKIEKHLKQQQSK